MLVGLIADTHIPEAGPDIWPGVYERFHEERVDAILHAGDIHILRVLDNLQERTGAPVYACRGNGDDGGAGRPVCPDDPRLLEAWSLDWEGFRIGLCHDMALPENPPHRTIESTMARYFGGPRDIVVHGDTHVAEAEVIRGTLLVNPGSPVYPRNMNVSLGTIGFLHLENGVAEAWVEQLHPVEGPLLSDGGVLTIADVPARHPSQWVLFALHGHDHRAGVSHGAVLESGFQPDDLPRLLRAARRRDPAAVLLPFHTDEPRATGTARLARPRGR